MFKSKRVRSLKPYALQMESLGEFRLAVQAREELGALLGDLGFSLPLVVGESLMPPPTGPVANFNANGKEVVQKDQPKVKATFTMWSTWNDWHGNSHTGPRVVTREVYPKAHISPPSEYITVLESSSGAYVSSRVLSVGGSHDEDVLHVVNLFLEVFGEFEIVSPTLAKSDAVKRLNWRVLPKGVYPFAKAKKELGEFLSQLPDNARPLVEDRIQTVTRFEPDFIAVGMGGFSDYVVFGFSKRDIFVLESHRLGNATYVLRSDWESVSRLSKKQILDGSLHDARLIHNHQWRRNMSTLLKA